MTDSKYSSRKFSSQGELNPFNSSNVQRSNVRNLRLAYPPRHSESDAEHLNIESLNQFFSDRLER